MTVVDHDALADDGGTTPHTDWEELGALIRKAVDRATGELLDARADAPREDGADGHHEWIGHDSADASGIITLAGHEED